MKRTREKPKDHPREKIPIRGKHLGDKVMGLRSLER